MENEKSELSRFVIENHRFTRGIGAEAGLPVQNMAATAPDGRQHERTQSFTEGPAAHLEYDMLEDIFVIFNGEEGLEFGMEINWHLGPAATVVSAQSAYIHRVDPVPCCQEHMESFVRRVYGRLKGWQDRESV